MGYRIEYRIVGKNRRNFFRIFILTALFFLSFLFLVDNCWPEGAKVVHSALCRVRSSAMAAALEQLTGELAWGAEIREAFSGFFHGALS